MFSAACKATIPAASGVCRLLASKIFDHGACRACSFGSTTGSVPIGFANHCSSAQLHLFSSSQPTTAAACRHTSNSSSQSKDDTVTSGRDDEEMPIPNMEDIAHHARQLVHDPARILMSAVGVPMAVLLRTNPAQLADLRLLEHQRQTSAKRSHKLSLGDDSMMTPLTAQHIADLQHTAEQLDALTSSRTSQAQHEELDDPEDGSQSPDHPSIADRLHSILAEASDSQTAQSQLKQLLHSSQQSSQDTWGTTRETPAEIARRIVESNEGHDDDGEGSGDDDNDDPDKEVAPSKAELAASSVETVQKDLKRLDEIFEVLAEVPWLDDSDIEQREKKGIVSVALLGTLEEAGWDLRIGIERIWAGERDQEAVVAGAGERESAALMSILFHTARLEELHGPPDQNFKPVTDFARLQLGESLDEEEASAKGAEAKRENQRRKPPLRDRKNV